MSDLLTPSLASMPPFPEVVQALVELKALDFRLCTDVSSRTTRHSSSGFDEASQWDLNERKGGKAGVIVALT
jgi:hypothetical protein